MENNVFAKRASVRKFKPDAIPQEVIEQLLFAATQAPSAGNRQPWHFYVVKNEEMKAQLCKISYNQKFIEEAPVVLVVCAEPGRSAERYEERGINLYCIQDTAAAIENILLCAVENGLGACWCGAFSEEEVSTAMGIDFTRRPIAIIPVGYPQDSILSKPKPQRRPMEETVTYVE